MHLTVSIAVTVQLEDMILIVTLFCSSVLGNIIKFLIQLILKVVNHQSTFSKAINAKISNMFLILLSNYFLNWQDKFFVEFIFGLKELEYILCNKNIKFRNGNISLVDSSIFKILAKIPQHLWMVRFRITGELLSMSCFSLAHCCYSN